MAVTVKGTVFWVLMAYASEIAQYFGGVYHLCLQVRRCMPSNAWAETDSKQRHQLLVVYHL